jgi:hypothetical protein
MSGIEVANSWRIFRATRRAFAVRAEAAMGRCRPLVVRATDATGGSMYARTGRDLAVLRVEDDLSPFLSARSAYWADLRPFPAILKAATAQGASVSREGAARRLVGKDAGYFEEGLRSLQAIDVIAAGAQLAPADTTVSLELATGVAYRSPLHSLGDGDYALAPSTTAGIPDQAPGRKGGSTPTRSRRRRSDISRIRAERDDRKLAPRSPFARRLRGLLDHACRGK